MIYFLKLIGVKLIEKQSATPESENAEYDLQLQYELIRKYSKAK